MNLSRLASILAIVGGTCWVLMFLLTLRPGTDGSVVLFWSGAVLVTAMGGILAVLSVRRAPWWLRVVVGLSGPLLGWMLLLTAYGPADSAVVSRTAVQGVVGAVAVLTGAARWRSGKTVTSRHRGAHAH